VPVIIGRDRAHYEKVNLFLYVSVVFLYCEALNYLTKCRRIFVLIQGTVSPEQ
jgi:hypothetical protein